MEILILVLLYYLSQNENFSESVKPLMAKIKDSEQMLRFLNDLSHFTQTFSGFCETPPKESCKPEPNEQKADCKKENKKNPQSPTEGIADEFIQHILDNYFNKNNPH